VSPPCEFESSREAAANADRHSAWPKSCRSTRVGNPLRTDVSIPHARLALVRAEVARLHGWSGVPTGLRRCLQVQPAGVAIGGSSLSSAKVVPLLRA
jgi:hypothetical protein